MTTTAPNGSGSTTSISSIDQYRVPFNSTWPRNDRAGQVA